MIFLFQKGKDTGTLLKCIVGIKACKNGLRNMIWKKIWTVKYSFVSHLFPSLGLFDKVYIPAHFFAFLSFFFFFSNCLHNKRYNSCTNFQPLWGSPLGRKTHQIWCLSPKEKMCLTSNDRRLFSKGEEICSHTRTWIEKFNHKRWKS